MITFLLKFHMVAIIVFTFSLYYIRDGFRFESARGSKIVGSLWLIRVIDCLRETRIWKIMALYEISMLIFSRLLEKLDMIYDHAL